MKKQPELQPNKTKYVIFKSAKITIGLVFFMTIVLVCSFFNLVGLPPALTGPILSMFSDLQPELIGYATINGGAIYTDDPNVILTMETQGTPKEMRISEDFSFDNIPWVPFQKQVNWTFSPEPGWKKIVTDFQGYLWFDYVSGHAAAATIFLDYTPILNEIKKTNLDLLSSPTRLITLKTEHNPRFLKLVFDNKDTVVFLEWLPSLQIYLPDESGCLYIFDTRSQPLIQIIGTGDMTIPVNLEKASINRNKEMMISGCISEPFTAPLTVSLKTRLAGVEDRYVYNQTTITPDIPFFTLPTKTGTYTINVYDNDNTLLTTEKTHLTTNTERLLIFDLEPTINKQ